MSRFFRTAIFGAGVAVALAAFAQTPTPPGAQPAAVGVTPQTAVEANQKAVPRSDTGTLVRTSPNAVDKAKAIPGSGADRPVSTNAPMADASSATTSATANRRARTLKPKPDRN